MFSGPREHGFRLRRMAVAVLLSSGLWTAIAPAAPFVPAGDDVVLERLPVRPSDPLQRELRALREAHTAQPKVPGPAVDLARRYFDLALETGDPRYIGYAEAALAAWRRPGPTTAEILVTRAQLAQYRHEFSVALALFDEALSMDAGNLTALSWRAAVNMVVARYDRVRPDCNRMRDLGEVLLATGCTAYLDATTGNARAAYDSLRTALAAEPGARPTLRLWTLTVLAEIARRLDRLDAADAYYLDALTLDPNDQYLLTAYAEFLILRHNWIAVVTLLRPWQRSDALLLLLARAERALGNPEASAHAALLRSRFADSSLRGDGLNAQDEAWFRLEFEGDAKGALALALQNWAVQKEPRDAEIVLVAALAVRDAGAARAVLDWMARTRLEDPRLAELAALLRQVI